MDKVFIAKMVFGAVMFIVTVVVSGLFIHWYNSHATTERKIKVDKFLLWAVAQAQIDLGSDTGPLKLSKVYGMFMATFPAKITSKITWTVFEAMATKAKADLVTLQKKNENINALIVERSF